MSERENQPSIASVVTQRLARKRSPVEWTGLLMLTAAGLLALGPPDPRDGQVTFLFWWVAVPLVVVGEVLRRYGRRITGRSLGDAETPVARSSGATSDPA